jgi:hypothetical protein
LQSSKQNGKGLKSCFAWNCKATTPSKPTKKIYYTQTKQNGKGLKAVSLGTSKTTTKQRHKGKSIANLPSKAAKIKKRSRCFVFDVD